METLDPRSWHGRFVPQCDENGTDCCLLGEDGLLCAPLLVDGLSVYRLHAAFRNVDGNGRLCLDIHVDDGNPFPQSVLRCPADPDSWQMFEVDLATARCPSGTSALLRIGRTANGTGTILVGRLAFRKLPRGSNQNAVPRLLGCEGILSHGIGRHEYLDAGQYTVVMEASMNELEQQSWRGRGIVAKRDERGVKCQSMEGEKSIIFVPMKVEPNTVYRLHLDLRRETGNGKLFCNLYASRSFDFPHVGLTCETGG